MKVLIDIAHPAHVHYFRNFAKIFIGLGHKVKFIARDRGPIIDLLKFYKLDFVNRGKKGNSLSNKFLYPIKAIYNIFKIAIGFRPDIFIDMGTVFSAPIAWIFRKPYIAFDDTETAGKARKLLMPFASVILTPDCFKIDLGKKHLRFIGYMELFYLHHKFFQPDDSIYSILGLKKNEKYSIVRFVSWDAFHDKGHDGLSLENKIKAVKEFSQYSKVFISCENEIPKQLKSFLIKIPPEKMHDALAFASLFYGESATMASECACLGVPAIYINNAELGYLQEEQNKYKIVYMYKERFEDQEKSIQMGIEILKNNNDKKKWEKKSKLIHSDKIDVTAFLVWFIENYPESAKIIKDDPEYQERFK